MADRNTAIILAEQIVDYLKAAGASHGEKAAALDIARTVLCQEFISELDCMARREPEHTES